MSGVCTSSCSGAHVSSSVGARGCESFATEVKCCVNVACSANGKQGKCVSSCGSGSDFVSSADGASGCGALPNDVRCCVPRSSGSSPNPGPSGPVLPSGPSCVAYSKGGTCVRQCPSPFQWSKSERGVVSGCESFPADVKCCHPAAGGGSPSSPSGPVSSPGNNNDRVPAAAIAIIKSFEGFFSRAYKDPRSPPSPAAFRSI